MKDEQDDGLLRYNTLKLSEFYEYLGRAADKLYQSESNWDLAEKIEALMDLLFPQYGLKRVPRGGKEDYASSSEESLAETAWFDETDSILTKHI